MSRKDGVLALLVVVVWGLNFVVIKVGLHNMPPLMLAGLRFMLVAFPAIFCRTTESTTEFAAGVWINHQFCAVCFSFCAINFGMPAGLASLVLQAQAFYYHAWRVYFRGATAWQTIGGDRLSDFGVLVLIEDSLNGQHVAMLGFMLTWRQHLVGRCGSIFNKRSCRTQRVRR